MEKEREKVNRGCLSRKPENSNNTIFNLPVPDVHLEELDDIIPLCEGDVGALLDMKASTLTKGLDDQVMLDALPASLCEDIKLPLKNN